MSSTIEEFTANEAAIRLGVRTAQVVADIQRGRLKGRYDATRKLNAGRWFVDRADVERRVAAAAGQSRAGISSDVRELVGRTR